MGDRDNPPVETPDSGPATFGTAATVVGVLGIVLYLAVGFLYLTSGLVVPFPWLFVLWGVWILGLYPLVRLFRSRRVWVPAVAVGAILFWWAFVSLGGAVLDWTA